MHPYKATGHEIPLEAKKRKLVKGTGKEFGRQSLRESSFLPRSASLEKKKIIKLFKDGAVYFRLR